MSFDRPNTPFSAGESMLRWAGCLCCALLLGGAAVLGVSCDSTAREHVAVRDGDCGTCHKVEFLRTTQPPHAGLFAETCGDCHGQEDWTDVTKGFDHKKFFALRGAHSKAECAACHTLGFAKDQTPKDCVGCHRDDYNGSTFPGHAKFATTCTDCHDENAWKPAKGSIDHDKFFPLSGAHLNATCGDCHTQGFDPGQTPKDCVGCHLDDYDSSPFPGHDKFATTCVDCHSTDAWTPAKSDIDHDKVFPLTGKHTLARCADCHTQGFTAGQTPSECVGCHRKDYDSSPYPDHGMFPTTCSDCHTTTGWTPATGGAHPDNKFRISSGRHSPFTCNDCHKAALGPNGAGNTDCVGCHTGQHARSKADAQHKEVSAYPSGTAPPNFCFDCHPGG